MRRNKLFGWLAGFASVAMAAGTSMAPVLAAVSENTPGGGNPGPVEEVVDTNTARQEEPTEEDKTGLEDTENLDETIARGANGGGEGTEMSGVYEFKDNKTIGTVTVVKKWDDQSNNAERLVVDVSLSTAKPSKNPLGYTVTFHADAEKGLTFADGSTENEVVYASNGQMVSGAYKGLTGGSGVVRWYTDKTYQTQVGLNADGTLAAPLTGDVDVWPKEVTFEIKGYVRSTKKNGFSQAIPNTATTVVFTDEVMPADATLIDVDADGDGGVVAWTEENGTVMKVSSQITGVKVQAANNSCNMFHYQWKLQTIDFTNLDTANVTNMNSMFYGCSGLTSLDLSPLDTSKVTDMGYMFSGCNGLTSLALSPLDTSKVTNMRYMFQDCNGLTSLDLSPLDTSKVTNMGYMFSGCSGLTSLNLSTLDTAQVTDMRSMFYGCSGLTSLDLSPLDTSNVTSMYSIFSGCSGLTSLDLSPMDTSNVTDMNSMFSDCKGLTSLDLSTLDTSKVRYMEYMFQGCSGLTTFITGSNFKFVGTDYALPGTWRNTAGETFTSGTFPSNVADTYTKIAS